MKPTLIISIFCLSMAACQAPGSGSGAQAGEHQPLENIEPRGQETSPAELTVTFIGNAAFSISDGTTTLLSDFPYQSGAFGYMTYDASTVQPKGEVLCLITHEHDDHFDPKAFSKTDWKLAAHPKIEAPIPSDRRLPFGDTMQYAGIKIMPRKTPHTDRHCSYLVEWHGKRFFFTGDTESADSLPKEKLDLLFITPWLLDEARKQNLQLSAGQLVIHHHRTGEKVKCMDCIVPVQGEVIPFK